MKERFQKFVAWMVLYGVQTFAAIAVVIFLLFIVGFWLYSMWLNPWLILMLVGVFAVVFAVERLGKKLNVWWGKVTNWASEILRPTEKDLQIRWSGTEKDDLWYVVAVEGGAKAGPMNINKACKALDTFPRYWGKCELKHVREFGPDPILDDLKTFNEIMEKKNDE